MSIEIVDVKAQPMIYLTIRTVMAPARIASELKLSLAQLATFMADNGIVAMGAPHAIYGDWGDRFITLEVGIPVSEADAAKASGRVMRGSTPAGPALKATHCGSRTRVPEVYARMNEHVQRESLRTTGLTWEVHPEPLPQDDDASIDIYMQLAPPAPNERRVQSSV